MQDALTMAPPVCVVIVDEMLVAKDIELIIGDRCPDARVVVARTVESAGELPEGRIKVAFVQHDAEGFLASALGQRITRDGGLVVLVGHEAGSTKGSAVTSGVAVLPIPFGQADVAALLPC